MKGPLRSALYVSSSHLLEYPCAMRLEFAGTLEVSNHLQKLADCARRMLAKKGNFHYNGERISQIKWLCRTINRFSRRVHLTLRRSVLKLARNWFILGETLQPYLDPPNQNGTMAKNGWMRRGKYSLLNDISRWRSCSGVPRGCVNRIRIWPLRRDDRSVILIRAGGTRRSVGPARV